MMRSLWKHQGQLDHKIIARSSSYTLLKKEYFVSFYCNIHTRKPFQCIQDKIEIIQTQTLSKISNHNQQTLYLIIFISN